MVDTQPVPALASVERPVAVTLFGAPQVTIEGRLLALARRQARALLFRISASARPLPRDQLAFLFWPDIREEDARRNLTVLLSQLRQALPPGAFLVDSSGIALNPALTQVDTASATALASAGMHNGRLDQLAAAAALYRGPFLDGLIVANAEEFQSWLTQERQTWERWYLDLLSALVDGYAAAGNYPAAIAEAQRALAVDPLAEELHRRLIELYGLHGDRSAAMRQFERCVVILERELGVEPLPTTRAAYEAARDGVTARRSPTPSAAASLRPDLGPAKFADGAAPAAVEDRQHALPVPATPLVGRDAEVAAALALMERADLRLLTLTGPGGTGKTRLALELLAQIAARGASEVFFVPLAPLRDPSLLLDTIARVCGVRSASEASTAVALANALAGRRVILALDNFEHLLPAAPQLTELLQALPDLQILVTSRQVLRLYGEQIFPVPPLPVPDLASLPPLDELAEQPALTLLLARIQAHNPHFALTADNAADLAAICVRLDGLPLALELAAARLRLMAPRALLRRLGHRLSLLTQGPQDLPERQRSLRAVIAWSYELLDQRERLLFEQLAVFAGSWPLDAAEQLAAVPGHGEPGAVLDGLTALLDASLVQQTIGVDGELRLQLLETVRPSLGSDFRRAARRRRSPSATCASTPVVPPRPPCSCALLRRLTGSTGWRRTSRICSPPWSTLRAAVMTRRHYGSSAPCWPPGRSAGFCTRGSAGSREPSRRSLAPSTASRSPCGRFACAPNLKLAICSFTKGSLLPRPGSWRPALRIGARSNILRLAPPSRRTPWAP